MKYIHVKNLERFHPGYKDRRLAWAKIHILMVQGDPEMEMINSEIDKWRFICFILLELQSRKPIPLDDTWLERKGFDLKKRPMSLTIQMLHNFIEIVTEDEKLCTLDKIREDIDSGNVTPLPTSKNTYLDHVRLLEGEYKKLIDRFGEEGAKSRISNLNSYILQIGVRKAAAKYSSHYHTILNWDRKNGSNEQPKQTWNVL